jgi:thioester reductase-like protein
VRTIVDVLRRRARETPEKRAYTFLRDGEIEESFLTYGELDRWSRAVALRLPPGRNVLLQLETGPEFLASFFGCIYAGAVPVPAPTKHARLDAIRKDAEIALTLKTAFSSEDVLDSPAPPSPIAFLQYTSGSTKEPRGVMVSHENLMHNLEYAARVEENDETSASVSWLPLHHDMGLVEGVLQPLYSGYPAYLFSPEAFLEKPYRWLAAISRYRATNSGAPNFAYDLCVRKISAEEKTRLDLRSWRVAYNGAEPVRASTLRSFFEAFESRGFRWRSFYPVYGLAESTLVVTSPTRDDAPTLVEEEGAVRVGCGRPRCGVRVEIVDPDRHTRTGVGEVWVRSRSNALGYWKRPDETRENFQAFLRDTGEGPFLRTGDLGFLRDGELFLVGRRKDVVVVRGRNYHPHDVEWTAERAHPSIRPGGVAVFSSADEDGAILLAEVSAPDESIPAQVRGALFESHGLRIDEVALVPPRTLLKTSSGKLRRAACREAYIQGTLDVLAVSKTAEPFDSLGAHELAARLGTSPQDVRLPRELVPEDSGAPAVQPKAILLTGATGFLGAHLLRELLERTEARVYCLVRGGAVERNSRVVPLSGDVSQPKLGLSEETYDDLAQSLDAIFHSAASVNFVTDYRGLSPVNVDGTIEALRLAMHGRAKRFHFVSTLGVGYTTGAKAFSEATDALPHLSELHLGYAETKAVAESLVRQASERGLVASIYRLSLLTGAEDSGRGNENDFLSRLLRGCVYQGAAPDLDVELDACPVDYAARAVVGLALEPPEESPSVFHVRNEKPRSFRELVLFLNLFGYPVALRPYRKWLPSLNGVRDPLHPLKPFFERRVDGIFLPERYEERRKARIESEQTRKKLERLGITSRRSSPAYLERCFRSFIERGALPEPARRKNVATVGLKECLSEALGREVTNVELTPSGLEQSILTEITSWYTGRGTGLYRADIACRDGRLRAFLKVKPPDRDVIEVARTVAELSSERLGRAFERFEQHIGFAGTHDRELEIYRVDDRRLRDHMPHVYGTLRDDAHERFVLALEDLPDGAGRQVLGRADIEAALQGLARIHAFGCRQALSLGPRKPMAETRELWEALFEHARPFFQEWGGDGVVRAHETAVAGIGEWSKELAKLPRTLIHNDFNPRNLYIRPSGTLCAFDWELATMGLPQRDLAELLCFTLSPDDDVSHFVDFYRHALERETETTIDAAEFSYGLDLALRELIVDRLPMYTLIHRFQKKRFLERVVPTWLHVARVSRAPSRGSERR